MKKSVFRILSLILALALVFSLAACSKEEDRDDDDDDRRGEDGSVPGDELSDRPDPEKEPGRYLDLVRENLLKELSDRYSGSPLAAVANSIESKGTLSVTGTISEGGDTLIVNGSLGFDLDAGEAIIDASMSVEGETLGGTIYISPDFWGVSIPIIFDNYTFYGVKPYDLYDQAVNSAVFGSEMDEETAQTLKELDRAIDILKGIDFGDHGDAVNAQAERLAGIFEDMELEVSGDKDGYTFTGMLDSNDLADIVDVLTSSLFSDDMLSTVGDLSEVFGSEFDTSFLDEMEDDIEAIRASGAACQIDLVTADDCLTEIIVTPIGEDVAPGNVFEINFFDDGAVSFTLVSNGEATSVSSTASSRNGYTHTITVSRPDQEDVSITAEYDDGALTLDMTSEGEHITATAALDVTSDGFTLSDISLSAEGETLELPLTVSYTSSGTIPAPSSLSNIFEMDEEELYDFIMAIDNYQY